MQELGLTTPQAQELLKEHGLNELPSKTTNTALNLFISQIKNVMALMLVIATVLSFVVGDVVDGVLVLMLLVLNVGLGFWQEYKASKELEALRKLEVANTRVLRDGHEQEIPATQLVPGDIIILESGDKVPADATLIESIDLMVNESALTGESLPVAKNQNENTTNTIFFGTSVTSGRGRAKVFATGANTKFGKIALTLSEVKEEQTPLEIVLDNLGKKIGILVFIVASLLFFFRLLQETDIGEIFYESIALMVAAVPQGLPAVITVSLAVGVHRMYKKKTLVRKMSSVESLGSATVICTDKTGTLTLNEMRVKEVESLPGQEQTMLTAAYLCNSASLVLKKSENNSNEQKYDVLGDSTEGALLFWAKDKGVDLDLEKNENKLLDEIPFSLKRRMMTVVCQNKNKTTLYSKGAPEMILPLCRLSEEEISKYTKQYEALAAKGLRVLSFAALDLPSFSQSQKIESVEKNLNFLGFVGIADEARPNVREAIQKAHNAGIKVVMITGDNELTAKAIGEQVGILSVGDEVLTGSQLDSLDDEELGNMLDKVKVYARVVPEHKLRIVQAFQKRGDVVAVTGDGVNDSLALKQAQVGVAMGQTGTDVAKEASDLVILDDNFVTIVDAVEEGRLIYHNIIKVVKFLLTGNFSEVLVIVVAVILGFPIPLVPVQILWINFVTDGLPALALVVDPSHKGIMNLKPQKHSDTLLSFDTFKFIAFGAVIITIVVLGMFIFALNTYDLNIARAWAFSTMVVTQMILVFIVRGFHTSPLSNKYLLLTVAAVLLAQVLIMTVPDLQEIFKIN